jgi:DNA (cytosine-5)-methyltransferase 1
MKLYEEILFLQHYYRTGKYVVENVIPYYEPLIPAQKRGRHLYWTNFILPKDLNDRRFAISQAKNELKGLCEFHNYDFNKYKGEQSVIKMARNLVDYEAGKTILDTAMNCISSLNVEQTKLF